MYYTAFSIHNIIMERPSYPFTPMLLGSASLPFDDKNYAFEVKYDGVRILSRIAESAVLYNRRLNARTRQYPEIAAQLKELCSKAGAGAATVLDGEIIALSAEGAPDFYRVMKRDRVAEPAQRFIKENPAYYMVFDVTELNGAALYAAPYALRREKLEALFKGLKTPLPNIKLVDSVTGGGTALFMAAEGEGLEGIVAKRLDSVYKANVRSHDWLKIKIKNYTRP